MLYIIFNTRFLLDCFASDLLLVYFTFSLNYRNEFRQNANSNSFLFMFKWVIKQQTTCDISNALGPGAANRCIVQ